MDNVANGKSLKKKYSRPQVKAQGSVEKITLEINKDYGASDGLLFEGQPVSTVS